MNDAFNRLAKDGYREEDILEMCMWVTAAEYFRMIAFQQDWDINRYKNGINRLPLMPWEDNGDDYFADVTQEDINDGVFDNPNFTMETAEQIKQRYQDFRAIFISIQKVMSPLLNEDIFLSSACELGIINNDNTPKSFSKETTAIIADHCVYANMKQRKKLINTVRSRHSRYLDSKHRAMLDAMEKTKYMILICKEAIPGIGVQVKNMLTGEVIRLMDINLSKQAEPGMTICSHIVEIEDIFMTTGAGLPIITNEALQEINGIVKQYLDKYAGLPSDVITKYNGEFATKIICTLLRQEAMERTRYK